ncbi:hypothetical protein PHMEG_00010584 [Phytophthora megakarya]|uniref:Uncharacterized protein n=1 Tax=Phytophthora megakarya TaxID=4795 RepID=A0A225WEC7_9STRA|nr:hypothetical protein PHMEG_00010584 [Phytophthora megakarya]
MVPGDFEAQLASEGATGSAEMQLAFQEEFALAESVQAKLQLVQATFVPNTPDFWYYSALCTVLEVQTLMETERHDEAWRMLGETKTQLELVERELTGRSCWRRSQRIHRRRLLLELDLLYKLKRPDDEIKSVMEQVTTTLHVDYRDPEPEGGTTEVKKETFPTVLNEKLTDLDSWIQSKLDFLRFSTTKKTALAAILRNLDVYGREITFQKVLTWDGPEEELWQMLEVFLDECPFEYADIPRYVEVVVKDVRRKKQQEPSQDPSFNFRAAHRYLSFSQLLECARLEPELFRNNSEFAVRGMQLLRAAAEVDSDQCSDLRNETQNAKELQHISTYLEFLRDFTPSAVDSVRVMILYRKLQLLNLIYWTNPNTAMKLLDALVEYINIAGGCTLRQFRYIGLCGYDSVSQANHDEILRKTLATLWSSAIDAEAVFSALRAHLDSSFLDVQHAFAMIKLGKGDFAEWATKIQDNGQHLSSQTSLTFCESNPKYFLPEDPLRIYVRTCNVKSLTAHLYEIKTIEYYSRLRREIKGDICLDGLLPTEEQVVDLSHLTQWQESRVPIEFRTTKNTQRGVFVVEVFEKGITCRAILRKGFLRHVERITTQGHQFTVLDERGNLLSDARALVLNVKSGGSRAQQGREYTPDQEGTISIPFRHANEIASSDKFAIAFCHGSFGNFHGSFSYLAESFDVDVDMHIDFEQLLPGSIAQLITRPRLVVAGVMTGESLDLLVDVKLVIKFDLVNTSNIGSSSHVEMLSFASIQHIVNEPPCFEIPMDADGFNITLEARVSRLKLGQDSPVKSNELPKVSDYKRFEVQRVNNFSGTYTAHLTRRSLESGNPYSPSEFRVHVLGHNGEPIPNTPVDFSFKHTNSAELIKTTLQADGSGDIKLGALQDIEMINVELGARMGSNKSCTWELPNLRSYRPQIVNCSVEETVEIPIPFAFSTKTMTWIEASLVTVCEVVDTVLQNAAHFSKVEVVKSKFNCPISIAVRIMRPGQYIVYVRPLNLKYPVTVCEKKTTVASLRTGLIIQPSQVLLATRTLPLTICSQELKTEGDHKLVLSVQLRNASLHSTRVFVILKHFLDTHSKKVSEVIVADGLEPAALPKIAFRSSPLENDFLKMRKISDEYAYILQRRALVSANQTSQVLFGSMSLPKPSLLQNPHVVSESDMEVVTVEAGDKVTGFKSESRHDIQSGGNRARMKLKKRSSRRSPAGHGEFVPSISFLGKQSHLLASSLVSPDGVVRFELGGLPFFSSEVGSFEVCTTAFNIQSGCVCTQELAMTFPSRTSAPVCTQELAMTFPSRTSALVVPKRDIRLSVDEALAPSEHFHQVDSHECIHPGEVKTLPRSFSSKYALYDNFMMAINLWPILTPGTDVGELASKLKEWSNLSLDDKHRFYYANACDDFHFYLSRKDPIFFRQFVKPLIEAKISKSLVDYYLLGDEDNLRQLYLSPAVFQHLCCVEKILVAERMTNTEVRTRICRAVIHEIESKYHSDCPTTLARIFNTVLSQEEVVETVSRYMDYDNDFGVRSINSSDSEDEDDAEDDSADDAGEEDKKKSKKVKQETPYIPPGKVRKVQEKRYFTGQNPDLSGCNKFWKEYAEHILHSRTSSSRFISSYFPEALISITEGLFALAVLDLDIESKPSQVQLSSAPGTHVTLSTLNDAILYHRSIGPAECAAVTNNYLILKQRIQDENEDASTELLVNKMYTTVVTLSNIGSEHLTNVNLLLQIPQGAIPMGSSGFYTKNEIGSVAPNYTSEFKFSFYFPEVGNFAQYPARASVEGQVISFAKLQDNNVTCKVVRSATHVNLTSWTDVSARGSLHEVVQFMNSAKPGVKIDYNKLCWRCRDETFFRGLLNHLRSSMIFESGIWKYGLLHRDEQTTREFFTSMVDVIQSVGSGFCSSFLDEVRLYRTERFMSVFARFDHCEFGPFLTRRVHPVTGRVNSQVSWGESAITSGKRILNAEARLYFGELCQRLGTHTRTDGQHLLVIAYYMVLFDRVEDSIRIFSRLQMSCGLELKSTVQYAYLDAFLDLFRTNDQQRPMFRVARQATSRYLAHPQPRWRQRFQKMHAFLEEYDAFEAQSLSRFEDMEMVDADMDNSPDDQRKREATSVNRNQIKLDASVSEGALVLLSQSLGQCELAFYPIDVELMFSTEPFNSFSDSAASASSLLFVVPRLHRHVDLTTIASDGHMAKTIVPIPDDLRASQMMIRIREIPSSRTVTSAAPLINLIKPYFNSRLNVNIMTQCGILQVLQAGLPVRACYIKVYAKVSSGGSRTKTEFYKDGYTDLLGKFDYVGINGDFISNVEKFSILISHEKFGASVEQADPPVLASTVGDFSQKEVNELLLY